MENGFKVMSQNADVAGQGDDTTASYLKEFDADADQMTDAGAERISEFQQILIDEVQARPMRALGWAVAAGAVIGFWAAK